MASWMTVFPNDFNDDRQPEMAIIRPNRKYISPKNDRHYRHSNRKPGVLTTANSKTVFPSDCNERQPEMSTETRNTFITEIVTESIKILYSTAGFFYNGEFEKMSPSHCDNNEQLEIFPVLAVILSLPVVSRCNLQSPVDIFELTHEYSRFTVGISMLPGNCSEISCNVKWNVYLAMEIPDCVSFISGQNSDDRVRSCEPNVFLA